MSKISETDVKSEIVEYLEGLNVSQLEVLRDTAERLYKNNLELTASLTL